MKKSKYSIEQIVGVLREGNGASVQEVCRRHNLSSATYYKWRQKYGGMEISEARRLKGLEEENMRLKRVVADQAVKMQILEALN